MPEESWRANNVRPYGWGFRAVIEVLSLRLLLMEHPPPFSREAKRVFSRTGNNNSPEGL